MASSMLVTPFQRRSTTVPKAFPMHRHATEIGESFEVPFQRRSSAVPKAFPVPPERHAIAATFPISGRNAFGTPLERLVWKLDSRG